MRMTIFSIFHLSPIFLVGMPIAILSIAIPRLIKTHVLQLNL